ncbi:glycosyltransferase family 2 protein [Chloroflexota bacterium]
MTDSSQSRPNICIILPCLNEESTVGKVIDEIPKQTLEEAGYQVEVLVVDNNSRDRTGEVARERGVRIITEPVRGKGRAVRTALNLAKADFIFILDADYTYPATYIPEMLDILNQDYHVVIGSRIRGKRDRGAIGFINIVGNILLTVMANMLYLTRISDICTGYWGIRGEIIPSLKLMANGFTFEAELFSEIAKKGYRIAEVPIYYRHRQGETKLNRLKDGIKIAWMLLTKRFS